MGLVVFVSWEHVVENNILIRKKKYYFLVHELILN